MPTPSLFSMSASMAALVLLGHLDLGGPGGEPEGPDEVRYGRDVRRLLSDRCFQCHGSDPETRAVDLRLDTREGALEDRGGYSAVSPGDVEDSELWMRITSDDPDEVMPPPEAKKRPLSADDIDVLARWIAAGADYEPHWAFVAPELREIPVVRDEAWPRNEIDRFVLAGLEARGVAPSPDADPATLLRRVYLDLTGLPPTVDELDAFLSGAAIDLERAYGDVVERLFTEEPWRSRLAERLATPWLDASRYADTIGIHTDNGRQMWLWRDVVLRAFRDNLPYDEFVTEQLAGDLLPDATTDQIIASGFNRNHVITDEGGAIDAEYLVEYAVDRANTTSAVFLGLTAGCARCHDHKFDPFTQEDFYSFFAFFNSNEEPGLYTQTPDANRAYEPFLEVPTPEQAGRLDAIATRHEDVVRRLEEPLPGEDERREAAIAELVRDAGVAWTVPAVVGASSSDPRVSLVPDADGVIVPEGPMPAHEDYVVELRSDAADLRALLIEMLGTEGEGPGAGRPDHGNAVVSSVLLEARPSERASADGDDEAWTSVPLSWAWADHTQTNRDFEATNVLDDGDRGWAADGNDARGLRNLVLLAGDSFGFQGGTELRLTLAFRSPYEFHSLASFRVHASPLASTETLPVALGRWYSAGPFRLERGAERTAVYDAAFGPEAADGLVPGETFGDAELAWTLDPELTDGRVVPLPDGIGVVYVGRSIWSPDARELEVSLGTDDGYLLFVNGEKVGENRVDRGAAPDQERVRVPLAAGENTLVLKICNTGGAAGYFFESRPPGDVLVGELPSALLPASAVPAEQVEDFEVAWRRQFDAEYRRLDDERIALEEEEGAIELDVPRAMVMRERAEPRAAFVLKRGQYDHADDTRPVERRTPSFLPPLPAGARRDRLGLAEWITSPENPLAARVAVNGFWQTIFGAGIVRTSEDFGLQGDWPTHPELLDWLAVTFRESGWDVHRLLRSIVTSRTYRQSSRVREDLAETDPDNRWLAAYPRRRLSAEQIRDHALYASGLLVERFGGPSVKPYQPEGLWREVAMLASNTREFTRGDGDDLWRRSVYTYWKRAVPPPSLQTFDAPTRESCVIRRQRTNTPLQALVLWNDVQFVEAARALALRALSLPRTDADAASASEAEDDVRLTWLFRTATGRTPDSGERALLARELDAFRERFAEAPDDAAALLSVGEAAVPAGARQPELAAWAMIASTVLNLHETLTQD